MAILRARWRLALYLAPAVPVVLAACGGKEQAPPPTTAPPSAAPTTTSTTTTTTTLPTPPPIWRGTHFGMTRAQALAAFPSEVQKLPQPIAFSPQVPGSSDLGIPSYEADGRSFRVLFGFEGDALNRVFLTVLKPDDLTCGEMEKQLTEKHAAPTDKSATRTNMRTQALVWKLPDQTVTLTCSETPGLGFRSVTLDYSAPAKN
jgi:hypothetical protein